MRLFFLLLFFPFQAFTELQDHFKKALNKTEGHGIKNIDFIYMINLDERPEKFQMSLDQLLPFGIYPYRFSAVNGWKLSLEAINDVGVKFSPEMEGGFLATSYHLDGKGQPSHEVIQNYGQTYFVHCLPRGAIGCTLSHLSVLQDAYDAGYETIWIMEDDIDIRSDPRKIPDLIDRLDSLVGKGNWDILFTDRDFRNAAGHYAPAYTAAKRPDLAFFSQTQDFSKKTQVSSDFLQIAARYGTTSMIIRRSGIRKLLQFFKAHQIYLPYDMDLVYMRGIKIYTVLEDIIGNLSHAISDVGNDATLKLSVKIF